MSYSISLAEKNIEEVYGIQWDNFVKNISPDQQFLNRDWYSAWESNHLIHEHPKSHVEYLSFFDGDNNLQGTFPHVKFSKIGLKILSVAGLYYPFRSILFSSGYVSDCAQAFVDTIHENHRNNIIRIGPTVEDELANRMIKDLFLARDWKCHEVDRGNTLVISLPETIDKYRESLGKKFTKKLERRKKSLSKLGKLEFVKYNNCSDEVWESVINECASVEKRSWLSVDKDAELRIFENSEFWKHYLRSGDSRHRVVVWLALLNGKPIAYSFAIDSGDRRYSFSGHYDKEYKKYGVGIIVDGCMFEDAISEGIKSVDMGTGEAEYKSRWGAKIDSRIVDYIFLPPNIIGRTIYSGLKLRNSFRTQ